MKNVFKLSGIIVMAAVIGFSFAACGNGSTDNGGGCEPIDIVLYDDLSGSDVGDLYITFTEGTHIHFDIDELKSALKISIDDIECPLDGDFVGPLARPWNYTTLTITTNSNPESVVTAGQDYKVTLVYTKPANAVGAVPFGYNHDLDGNFDPFIPMESFTFEKTVTAKDSL